MDCAGRRLPRVDLLDGAGHSDKTISKITR
jgi:hypothetical protein